MLLCHNCWGIHQRNYTLRLLANGAKVLRLFVPSQQLLCARSSSVCTFWCTLLWLCLQAPFFLLFPFKTLSFIIPACRCPEGYLKPSQLGPPGTCVTYIGQKYRRVGCIHQRIWTKSVPFWRADFPGCVVARNVNLSLILVNPKSWMRFSRLSSSRLYPSLSRPSHCSPSWAWT